VIHNHHLHHHLLYLLFLIVHYLCFQDLIQFLLRLYLLLHLFH
jgi:hypothetical protein